MTTLFDCALNGVLLSSLSQRISILDIQESAPKVYQSALTLFPEGRQQLQVRRDSITVKVLFAIHEEKPYLRTRVLERLDALTGETLGTWPFPAINTGLLIMCQAYRYMLIGGYVHGQPVIIMEQGTYENMYFQCYNADMSLRWERVIEKDEGPRAAHSVPVMDWNKDGVDEIWFGEHLMSLDTGEDLFCMARDSYFGHSDVVAPFTDFSTGKRYIFTCREGANYKGCPRIVMFNEDGTVAWQDVYENPDEGKDGHINGGFVFLDKTGRRIAVGKHIRPGVQFVYDAVTGEKLEPAMDYFYLRPIDLNGDGCHEFLRKQR